MEVLPEHSRTSASSFAKLESARQFYLAGGTAAALYLGHRISGDLDFFSQKEFDESFLISALAASGDFQLEQKATQSVLGILSGTKMSFLGYPYPLLSPLQEFGTLRIADIHDIACMKIDAVSARGARRDFIDLYFILTTITPFSKILPLFEKKYASLTYNLMHVKKSLVYFSDAEEEPMPNMLKPVQWEKVKLFFEHEVKRL